MSDYNLSDLQSWNERIEALVAASGLDCYEQQFEIVSYEDMLCYEAYIGMPSHYPHWSFGKSYERQRTFYQYNLSGLPYELVINSNPCLAYLMRDNTLLLQILTIAHVYGHNDFFKNNRLFRNETRAELTVETFKAHADRVRAYVQDPSIGPEKVERILDAAHGLKLHIRRRGAPKLPDRKLESEERQQPVPERLAEDLLGFLAEKGNLLDWERDLVEIVRAEAYYFLPQIETKIMNEGWASYWHYTFLNRLGLPQQLHLEFLQRHNLVVRPFDGKINPYFVGYKMFDYLIREHGLEKALAIRSEERDESFLRRYLNRELCEAMHLFAYESNGMGLVVSDVSDEAGWKSVRDLLASSVGMAGIPVIRVSAVENGCLQLQHEFDGRELELTYAAETLKYVATLWGRPVNLQTTIAGQEKRLSSEKQEERNVATEDIPTSFTF